MRLFIGYTPPVGIMEQINGWAKPVLEADLPFRWARSPTIHLTLHFLGDVNTEQQQKLISGLDLLLADTRPFPILTDGLGAFIRNGAASILWAGIKSSTPLTKLREQLSLMLKGIGFTPDNRPFSPHFSLARIQAGHGPVSIKQLSPYLIKPPPLTCQFDHLSLFSSFLLSDGPRHDKVKEYRLV